MVPSPSRRQRHEHWLCAREYARAERVALQVDALKVAGCTKVLAEVASGAATERPILTHLPAEGVRAVCSWERFCTFAREPEQRKVAIDARVSIYGIRDEVDPAAE
jgi:hypothetical protein